MASGSALEVPAQEYDPEHHQREKYNKLGPHDGQETALLDLPLLLDEGVSTRFLVPDQPEVAGGDQLVALLVQEHGRSGGGEPEDQVEDAAEKREEDDDEHEEPPVERTSPWSQ